MAAKLLEIADVCELLHYGRKKVYQLIRDGKLRTVGEGRGLRVVATSVDRYIDEEAAKCHERSSQPDDAAVKVRTSGTKKTSATSGKSTETASDTQFMIEIPTGQKLDLQL